MYFKSILNTLFLPSKANAGDSRAVLSVKGEAQAMSTDHKPANQGKKFLQY